MRGGAIPLLAWGTLLLVLYVGNWIWQGGRIVQVGVTLWAILVIYGGAGLLWLARRDTLRRGPPELERDPEALPRVSLAAVVAGLSVGAIAFGMAWARFIVDFGVAMLVLSLGRLAIELRAERRSRRRVVEESPR